MPTVLIRNLEHYPDLKGGEELLTLLLENAGYKQDVVWEARWTETAKCDSNAPPLQVRHYVEHAWAIRLTCKPRIGDAHFFHLTLYLPSTIQDECILGKLKAVEEVTNQTHGRESKESRTD